MLNVVRADFAGDNVGCWMQIQVGKGPWASEVSGLVKIGQTMTMVLAIKDDEQKFDMLVRNCMAHDGKRAPIQLVDQQGCVTRPKLMSKFNKIKNFGASASVLSYAHFQAFKFPDSMEVHFQCTIQICRYACPDQCPSQGGGTSYAPAPAPSAPQPQKNDDYGAPVAAPQSSYNGPNKARTKRYAAYGYVKRDVSEEESDDMGDIGIEKVIHVVSSGDLTFDIKEGSNDTVVDIYPSVAQSLHEEQVMCNIKIRVGNGILWNLSEQFSVNPNPLILWKSEWKPSLKHYETRVKHISIEGCNLEGKGGFVTTLVLNNTPNNMPFSRLLVLGRPLNI